MRSRPGSSTLCSVNICDNLTVKLGTRRAGWSMESRDAATYDICLSYLNDAKREALLPPNGRYQGKSS